MAHRQDEDQDRLEIELRRPSNFPFPSDLEGSLEKIPVPAIPNLRKVASPNPEGS